MRCQRTGRGYGFCSEVGFRFYEMGMIYGFSQEGISLDSREEVQLEKGLRKIIYFGPKFESGKPQKNIRTIIIGRS